MQASSSDLLLHMQSDILEAIALGEPLRVIGEALCRKAEQLAPGVRCSILAVDGDGLIHPLAAPSLPLHYSAALEGLAIGPKVGSCGTAAYRGEPVVVTDIASDPLWDGFRELALPIGLRACWSSPIKARDGRVVGTFAFYYTEPKAPEALEQRIVTTCVHLCAIALEHEEVQLRNKRLAYFDPLTGLPNRGHFNDLLAQRIEARRPFGLLFVDIDHLKIVNDTMGHVFGDILIKHVAARLGLDDVSLAACRLGGDEFAVLVDGADNAATIARAARRILSNTSTLIEWAGHTYAPNVTIGGALYGVDGIDGETLCQNADFALYHAKETQRAGFVKFTQSLRTSMMQHINLVRSVDLALTQNRILPHYQPVVRLDTGRVIGMEALARMRRPDGRVVSAGEFQSALSDPNIAYRLTDVMLEAVATDIRHWLDLGVPLEHVGFNVTTSDFQRGNLEERIVGTFERAGVPLHHLILEVNEAVFMGGADNIVEKTVEALRKRGIMAALDDFGTGFASLTHLLNFPVDIIKIDKSFVDRMVTHEPSAAIVAGILDIARKLDMRVVAEGVETDAQSLCLQKFGCRLGQGYLFARPMPFADMTDVMLPLAQSAQ